MKLKTRLLPLLVLLALLPLSRALALEIKAGRLNPFIESELTVTSDKPGLLTIHVEGRKDAVTAQPIEAGTTTLTWRVLSWNDEPLPGGEVLLTAELTTADGEVETASCTGRVRKARSAILFCLPEHDPCTIGGDPLKIELGVSVTGRVHMELVRDDKKKTVVWVWNGQVKAGNDEFTVQWNWRGAKSRLTEGAYILRAWATASPEWIVETPITLTKEVLAPAEPFVTGPLIPEDLDDEAAVWAAITAPVVVGVGGEAQGLRIYAGKDLRSEILGHINCATVCMTVLDTDDPKWIKVGVWRQIGGEYTEGYVMRKQVRVTTPNCRYGAVVNKNTQTMRIYEAGHLIATIPVSTGLQVKGAYMRNSETRAGAYLVGGRWIRFADKGYTYEWPIRIDGKNLMHQLGWRTKDGIPKGFEAQLAQLGTKASHGCVRIDCRPTEENGMITPYWIWTHFAHNTKILVIDDPEARHARMDELGMSY
ncbi:MAG: L,D-transpeptidase [Clostridia bacterium]|nr:L,D-transpeptidase [Clostridia bacterium]